MNFKMVHENYNVADLDKSMAFYEKALGLHEVRRINGDGHLFYHGSGRILAGDYTGEEVGKR